MIQIRKEDNQKKQKEKKLKVYKVNTHKKTVIALWVLLAVSFLDRKSTRLNSSHWNKSRMPSSA